ncbi:hypothetical protein MMC07_007774 [Pseudocyphellaria aurata]|nr:hypothetical protein [Pseudocyphellaria aurata]
MNPGNSSTSITWQSNRERVSPPDLRLLHFNDVYHIEPGSAEPVGGISRFQYLVNQYYSGPQYKDQSGLMVLFSGDAYNPSLESSVTKGAHMVPILNQLPTKMACVGNHDLDFGLTQFKYLRSQCNFPWLLANVLDPALGTDVALAGCQKTAILESSNGIKVGFIGLGEREWLDTINSLPQNLIYKSASETARLLVPELRAQGAEIVIALTHMREPNDLKLAEKTPLGLLDMVLGGHDHFYAHHLVNGVHVLRSGTDFKQMSYIEARRKENGQPGWDIDIIRRDVVRVVPEDKPSVKYVEELTSSLKHKLEKPIGYTSVPLDGRFTTVRTKESNLGNFVCDLMRHYYNADCAIMASGTIRGDQIYPPGVLQLKDIMNCFPFEDPVVVLRLKGKNILNALHNSVSQLPALEGRFPQVSNTQFGYDPALPSQSRVLWVKINNEPLDQEKEYTLATRGYMARGKDGYDSLLIKSEGGDTEEVVSEENGILISMIMRQYFMSLKVVGKWTRWGPNMGKHWKSVNERLHEGGRIREPGDNTSEVTHERSLSDGNSKIAIDGHHIDSDTDDELDLRSDSLQTVKVKADAQKQREKDTARKAARKWMRLAGVKQENVGIVAEQTSSKFMPHWTKGIAPR